ncbi:uncharacterized protein LOC118183295 [Stegodyphus dumicola]|uniref:uncharacterized protein LOC118183295 n=1 Tax=Stegodyphus dumicola TaxID=202533 RepID=UPI0015AEE597|nr:uncharacterized protein LOC118183295 [Stegodyphus dumicola]
MVLQWVPGHCGLWGNEQADLRSKTATSLLQYPNTAISYWRIKLFLKSLFTSSILPDLQTRTALKSWRMISPSLIPDSSRLNAVAAFRLSKGHNCLTAHLHRIGISSDPICSLCDSGEEMDRVHLLRCVTLRSLTEVSRYWEARELF